MSERTREQIEFELQHSEISLICLEEENGYKNCAPQLKSDIADLKKELEECENSPTMYGSRIQVSPGKKWTEDKKIREEIQKACKIFAS